MPSSQFQLHSEWVCSSSKPVFPKTRMAAARAAPGSMPWLTFSAICCSRWNSNSWFKRDFSVPRLNSINISTRIRCNQRMPTSQSINNQINGCREALPTFHFFFQARTPGGGERVELDLPSGLAFAPFTPNPALLLQAVQCGIQRSLLHLQHLIGCLLDSLGDGPAVLGLQRKRFQDQQVQCSLHQVIRFAHSMIIYNGIVDGQGIVLSDACRLAWLAQG